MKRRPILIIPIIILAFMVSMPGSNLRVRGTLGPVGLICLADPSSAPASNPCPFTPYVFDGPSPSPAFQKAQTQILIGVFINNSDTMSGFDIELKTDSSILKPAGISLSGSLVPANGLLLDCIGGVLVKGVTCSPTDTVDTIHTTMLMPGPTFLYAPVTGLLFTAIYNITGSTPTGGVAVGYQTGCARTSVAGSTPPVCVSVADGTNVTVPETVQSGTKFDNSVQPSWVAITSKTATLSFPLGASTGNTVAINATAENGWPTLLSTDSIGFSTAPSSTLTTSFSPGSCATLGATCQTILTVTASIGGTSFLTVLGTYVFTDDTSGLSDTLIGPVTIQVNVLDVGWTINNQPYTTSQTMYFGKGTFSIPYTFQSLGGFSGSVTIGPSACNSGTTGIICPVTYPPTFTLTAGQTTTKQITLTATANGRFQLRSTLAATPLPTKTSGVLTILISGFSLSMGLPSTPATGSPPALTLIVKSLGSTAAFSFAGSVSLSTASTPAGLNISPSSATVFLNAGTSATLTMSFTSAILGTYTVQLTGTGGTGNSITNQTAVLFFNLTSSISQVNARISGATGINSQSGTLPTSTLLNAVNVTTGVTYTKNANVMVNFNPAGTGHLIDEIQTSPYWLSINCELGVTAGSATCFLSRTLDIFHTGTVDINDYSLLLLQYGLTSGSPGFDPRADFLVAGRITIADISIGSLYFGCTVIP